ncbi:MAG TPA: hypothetical protein DC020_00080 [Flavobacterium sp.]|nr:MAG: hypothetical protein A2X07_10550 [Flavobacteria bacterium GWF1_32_7]HBD25222.1 hypothetical protein [Flavobacterium sp.]
MKSKVITSPSFAVNVVVLDVKTGFTLLPKSVSSSLQAVSITIDEKRTLVKRNRMIFIFFIMNRY